MDLATIAAKLTSNVGFIALYLCLLLSFFAFLAGSIRAWSNGSFDGTLFHGWIKKDGPPIAWVLLWLTLGAAVSLVDVTSRRTSPRTLRPRPRRKPPPMPPAIPSRRRSSVTFPDLLLLVVIVGSAFVSGFLVGRTVAR